MVRLAKMPPEQRQKILAELTPEEKAYMLYDWPKWARPSQLEPPGNWKIWFPMAGRGFGKTRVGAEWVRSHIQNYPRWHFVGPTAADVRDTMVEGESGILSVFPPDQRPHYETSKRKITFHNGAVALLFSAEEPERLRGPQCYAFWGDELAAWRYPDATFDQLMFGFRLGDNPRGVLTTTPKPLPIIKRLLKDPSVKVTRGSTYENRHNLAQDWFDTIIARYKGTRLERQEIYAEVIEDVEGALWQRAMFEACRLNASPDLQRVVVAVDPATSANDDSDETGIVVGGVASAGRVLHGYILADLTCRMKPEGWARRAVNAYKEYMADAIIAEANQGGDLVESTIRAVDPNVNVKLIHASKGKYVRAEPVSAYYEQGRVHHVGVFAALEDQLCSIQPGRMKKSPDRGDAAVYVLTELMGGEVKGSRIITLPLQYGRRVAPMKGL